VVHDIPSQVAIQPIAAVDEASHTLYVEVLNQTRQTQTMVVALSAPSDRLAKALTALGQALKSLSLLRYIQDDALRGQMQLQLNRGERRHQLARRLFFANQGACQTGDYEEMMTKATCLSLLSNTVVVWNTVQMTRIIDQLRANGETMAAEDLARGSPLAFAHVIPNGTSFVRQAPRQSSGGHRGELRPLSASWPGNA
jgi:hypothetical protein